MVWRHEGKFKYIDFIDREEIQLRHFHQPVNGYVE